MIEFLSLEAHNFGSWEHFYLSLQHQGTVCVQGLTGAGKSSLFRPLSWCLYGTTPDAVKADEVRRTGKPTEVQLAFSNGEHTYQLTRYRKHPHYGNKVMFEGYGIPEVVEDSHTKTVQGLINKAIGMNELLFRTTTYFAQGHFHQFRTLTEQAKKTYIESLTYGSLFQQCEGVTRERARAIERTISRLEGRLEGLGTSIATLKEQTVLRQRETQAAIESLQKKCSICVRAIESLEQECKQYLPALVEKQKMDVAIELAQNQLQEALDDVQRHSLENQICPRCGLSMLESLREERLFDACARETRYAARLDRYKTQYGLILLKCQRAWRCQDNVEEHRKAHEGHMREIALLQRIYVPGANVRDLLDQQRQLKKELQVHHQKLAYISFWTKGFGFQGLRSMVLEKAIAFFSERVREYLYRLMTTKLTFDFYLEQNRLVMECNGRSHGALSGGERQSVDLCIGFGLRDVAEVYNKCGSNLLILDEPFTYCDPSLAAKAQDFLAVCAKPSTFVIFHGEPTVRFDGKYSVSRTTEASSLQRVY